MRAAARREQKHLTMVGPSVLWSETDQELEMARSDTETMPRTRSPLRWRIVIALLTVSLLPLCLLGAGAWLLFGRILENKALELQQSVVERHAHAIDAYLAEHLHLLRLLADTHDQR